MKRIFTIAAALIMTANLWAQAPGKMSYQAVVRNTSNALVASTPVGMQISILQGSASGTSVFVETQTPTTNSNGLVSLEIGSGIVVSGAFAAINWAAGPYFIKTETDPTGGTSYTITGTSELMSVPYALHAKTAGEKTYTIGLHPELGGYVFRISSDGKHGLVAETQDQSVAEEWYLSPNIVSDPANHSIDGQKFMDWRLPTKFELNEMSLQYIAIGGFSSNGYWSSTHYDDTIAWKQVVSSGNIHTNFKNTDSYVRAVRTF
jgi:hypothetical protein